MIFIAFTGYDRCGKDTVATMLTKHLRNAGYKVYYDSLARPLKEMVAKSFRVDPIVLEKMKNDNVLVGFGAEIITTREAIIRYAEGLRSKLGQDIFARILVEESLKRDVDVVVIPDLRFIPEYHVLKDGTLKSLIVKVNSDISTCGANGIRYDVDKIKPDININNHRGNLTKTNEEVKLLANYIIENMVST